MLLPNTALFQTMSLVYEIVCQSSYLILPVLFIIAGYRARDHTADICGPNNSCTNSISLQWATPAASLVFNIQHKLPAYSEIFSLTTTTNSYTGVKTLAVTILE